MILTLDVRGEQVGPNSEGWCGAKPMAKVDILISPVATGSNLTP